MLFVELFFVELFCCPLLNQAEVTKEKNGVDIQVSQAPEST
jgi:hypothetical protein